jgi:hypothetical protein
MFIYYIIQNGHVNMPNKRGTTGLELIFAVVAVVIFSVVTANLDVPMTGIVIGGKGEFGAMAGPSEPAVFVNTPSSNNYTTENLTCWANATDSDGDNLTYSGFWYKDGEQQLDVWNVTMGGIGNDYSNAIVTDSAGNIYVTGYTLSFGAVGRDVLTIKYDSNGDQLWNRTIGGTGQDYGYGIAVDDSGDIYIAGYTNSFGVVLYDIWIIKYNSSGDQIWNKTTGGTGNQYAYGMTIDDSGDIYVAGSTDSMGAGNDDFWIIKYNSSGDEIWNTTTGGTFDENIYGKIALDSAGNIYATGNTWSFGAGTPAAGNVWTVKYNSSGDYIWNKTAGGTAADYGNGLALDSTGNIYVAAQTASFGVGIDFWTIKYNSSGDEIWNKTAGGTSSDRAFTAGTDNSGNAYIVGATSSFGAGGEDVWVIKYDSNGNQLWNKTAGGTSNDYGDGITLDGSGNIYVAANTRSFGAGLSDVWTIKYYGFDLDDQVEGTLVDVSRVDNSSTSVGDVWSCEVRAYDGQNYSDYSSSGELTIYSISPNQPSVFVNSSLGTNLTTEDLTCWANATEVDGTNVSYNGFWYKNSVQNLSFDTSPTNYTQGTWVNVSTLDSSSTSILENWSCQVRASDGETNGSYGMSNNLSVFEVIGIFNATIVLPIGNINVEQGQLFTVTARIGCNSTTRNCTNIAATLDPIIPYANLTDPTEKVHDVYADSEFIYAASDDNSVYVWNKSDLSSYANLSSSTNILRTVFADSDYIYAGGRDSTLYIWNRTDYSTPFAIVDNITMPDVVFQIISDDNYIYVSYGEQWGGDGDIYLFNKTDLSPVMNLTDPTDVVKGLDEDDDFLYAGSNDCSLYIYNKSNFSQSPVTLSEDYFCDSPGWIKDVSVDNKYIYSHGTYSGWDCMATVVWDKSTRSIATFHNESTSCDHWGITVDSGRSGKYFYLGGGDNSLASGYIHQVRKSDWAIVHDYNITDVSADPVVKSIYCDADYLYAGIDDQGGTDGWVMLFNNPCFGPITISSINIFPSKMGVGTGVECVANVTAVTTITSVNFSITLPDLSEVDLGGGTQDGDIWTSPEYTTTAMGIHKCTVTAVDNSSNTETDSTTFTAGIKGTVPMNSGTPFYTTSQNPTNGSYESCLASLGPGEYCDITWTVNASGLTGTWQFFAYFEGSYTETDRFNVTIIDPPTATEFNTSIGSTNFSAEPDLNNVTNLTLATADGQIQFPTDYGVDASGEDYDTNIEIGDNFISVSTSVLDSTFNASANLTLNNVICPATIYYGAGVYTTSQDIINEGNVCTASTDPACTNINCTGTTLTFTVSHFTGFASSCVESWSCGSWSTCTGGTQTRTCTDANACGTITNRPALSQSCTVLGAGKTGSGVVTKIDIGTEPKTATLKLTDKAVFTIKNIIHYIQIKDVYTDYITIVIHSPDAREEDLFRGKTKKIDVDDDGILDIAMTLEEIYTDSAKITFQVIEEKEIPEEVVPEEEGVIEEMPEEVVPEEEGVIEEREPVEPIEEEPLEPTPEKEPETILVIIITVVIIGIVYLLFEKKKNIRKK